MRYMLLILCLFFAIPGYTITLRPDAPARYEVQPGDSLWGIANRYLVHPWEWHALLRSNPNIKNPNRLYPGAIIELRYHKKNPYLKVSSNGTIKLSPRMRPTSLDKPIPVVPLSDIKPFLSESIVLDDDFLADAPRVVAFTTEHMMGGQGDEVYVKWLCPPWYHLPEGETVSYAIYRPSGTYKEPRTKRFLGYKAVLVGYGELLREGDPAAVLITDIIQGIKLDDKVMPNNYPEFNLYFEPKAPSIPVQGSIIDMMGDFMQGAVGLVAVIDRGVDAGLQPGDVLGIYSRPRLVNNNAYRFDKKPPCQAPCIQVPPERIGEMMVFRTFTHTSLALVVRSTRATSRFDTVTNP